MNIVQVRFNTNKQKKEIRLNPRNPLSYFVEIGSFLYSIIRVNIVTIKSYKSLFKWDSYD